MKKAFIAIVVIVVLIFASDKVYKIYSRNNVNSHEAIILINNRLSAADIDQFFNLKPGTYDAQKHLIVFSMVKKDAYLLDTYLNLPAKPFTDASPFDCDIDYDKVIHYGFYNYEIGSPGISARMILKDAGAVKRLNPEQQIAERQLGGSFEFGKINVFDVGTNGFVKRCSK